ncbi:MAG: leukotoxin LktA family filamentous adhesin [Veillonellales bacterium]
MASMQRTWRRAWGYEKPSWQSTAQFNLRRAAQKKNKPKAIAYDCLRRRRNLAKQVAASIVALQFLGGLGLQDAYAASNITLDNRTATKVDVNGNVTDIHTDTFRGKNAFNSFKDFNVASGDIVNLHFSNSNGTITAANLLNYVSGGHGSNIDGMLNGIKNGKIGGNVFLLNPYGIMVGKTGVINVGTLTAATPSQSKIDDFLNNTLNGQAGTSAYWSNFKPDDWAKTVPLSADGSIVVQGKINAANGISVRATDFSNAGIIRSGASFTAAKPDFSDLVNDNGLTGGTKIAVDGGTIEIVADKDIVNSGKIVNEGAANQKGGAIDLKAGNDITLTEGAVVSVKGNKANSGGGNVRIAAEKNAYIQKNAMVDASAGTSGDGGAIEFSGSQRVDIQGGNFKAGAQHGKTGSVLIDPAEIDWSGSGNDVYGTDGTNYEITATDSITLTDVVISTRQVAAGDRNRSNIEAAASTGDSGAVTIDAPQINIKEGTKIYAQASGDYKAGNVTIKAASDGGKTSAAPSAKAGITIGGTDTNTVNIQGNNVTVTAEAASSYSSFSGLGLAETIGGQAISVLGIDGAGAKVDSEAAVTIGSGVTITAADTADISAKSTAKNEIAVYQLPLITGSVNDTFNFAGMYAELNSTAAAKVESGAAVSGSNVRIGAQNEATLKANIIQMSKDQGLGVSVVVSKMNVDTTAGVDRGAVIKAGKNVSVTADNTNNISTSSTVMALDKGSFGIAVNVSNVDTKVNAAYNADLKEDNAANKPNLIVDANDNIKTNSNSASTAVGSDAISGLIVRGAKAVQGIGGLNQKISGKVKTIPNILEKVGKHLDVAGCVNYIEQNHTANASIGKKAVIQAKDVTVLSKVSDAYQRLQADSSIDGKNSTDAGLVNINAAVLYADIDHDVSATVGEQADITADHLGLLSNAYIPYDETYLDDLTYDGFTEFVAKHANGNLGLAKGYMNVFVQATDSVADSQPPDASKTYSLCGAAAITDYDNTSRAVVERGAKITLAKDTGSGKWDSKYDAADDTSLCSWDSPLTILAKARQDQVYVGGNISILFFGTTGTEGSKSVGATTLLMDNDNSAQAYIAEGVKVNNSTNAMTVQSDNDSGVLSIAPSAGSGASFGANGVFSLATVNDSSEASVDDETKITSGVLTVAANEDENIINVAGAVNSSSNTGVGFGIAVNNVTDHTKAYIGDNDADNADGSQLGMAAKGHIGDYDSIGYGISANAVDVDSDITGAIHSISVAAAESASDNPDKKPGSGLSDKIKKSVDGKRASLSDWLSGKQTGWIQSLGAKIAPAEKLDKPGGSDIQQAPNFSIAAAGSSSVNAVDSSNQAYIDGVKIVFNFGNAGVAVNAVNNTFLGAWSGGGALTKQGNKSAKFSAGVAGAIALNLMNDSADDDRGSQAYISNSTIENADSAEVLALTGGQQFAIGLGIGIQDNNSQTAGKSGQGGFSVSLNKSGDIASAKILNSTVGGDNRSGKSAVVTAYDKITTGTGGAAVLGGNSRATIGAALTYSDVGNQTEAIVDNSTVENFTKFEDTAQSASTIVSAALGLTVGTAGDGKQSGAFMGGVAINDVHNTIKAAVQNHSAVNITDTATILANDTRGVDDYDKKIAKGSVKDYSYIEEKDENGNVVKDKDGKTVKTQIVDTTGSSYLDYDDSDSVLNGSAKKDGGRIIAVAGVGQGAGSNIGTSIVYNKVKNTFAAGVDKSSVTTGSGGTVNVTAAVHSLFADAAAGVGVAKGNFAGAGSVVWSDIGNNTTADISNADIAADQLKVNAADDALIATGAGQVSISLKVPKGTAAGLALGYNTVSNTTSADITNTGLTNSNKDKAVDYLQVQADSEGKIYNIAAAGGAAENVDVNGSVSLNNISNTTSSEIKREKISDTENLPDKTVSAKNITVKADDNTDIYALSGAVGGAGKVAVGAATAWNEVANKTTAKITDDILNNAFTVGVEGDNTATIRAAAAGIGGAKYFGGFGSLTTNIIKNTTGAAINTSVITGGQADVSVLADSQGEIDSLAGGISIVPGSTAVGAGVAVNKITDTTDAYIKGDTGQDYNIWDLQISGKSGGVINTIAVGEAVGGDVGAAGSFVTNIMNNVTDAYISGGAKVIAAGNVGVLAENDDSVDVIGNALGIGATAVGAGLTVVVNDMGGSTNAYVSGSGTQVDAKGTGGSFDVNSGELQEAIDVSKIKADNLANVPDLSEKTTAVKGLAVAAVSHQAVIADAVSLGVSGEVGAAVLPITNVMSGKTNAYIDDGAKIDTNLAEFTVPQVYVNASSQSFAGNLIIGAAGGTGVAATGAVSTNNLQRTTHSYISGATIGALAAESKDEQKLTGASSDGTKALKPTAGAVTVKAAGSEKAVDIVAGLAGGGVSGAGTAVLNIFHADTQAYVQKGLVAANSLSVDAATDSGFNAIAGTGAFSSTLSAAGTFVVGVGNNTTKAYVGDEEVTDFTTTIALAGDLTVDADMNNDFTGRLVGGAISGDVGLAGAAGVTSLNNDTAAGLYHVKNIAKTAAASSVSGADNTSNDFDMGNVTVNAAETVKIDIKSGLLAGGGIAGLGAGVNVVVLKSRVDSEVQDCNITTPGTFAVTADGTRNIDLLAASGGAGLGGLSGAVSLILIGSGTADEAMNQLDEKDNASSSGILTELDTFGSTPGTIQPMSNLDAGEQQRLNSASLFGLKKFMYSTNDNRVHANISAATITAKSVNVEAEAVNGSSNIAGAGAIGLGGVGGAVGYTRIYDNVAAVIDTSTVTSPDVEVDAAEKDGKNPAAQIKSYAGTLGFVGLGAAVADAHVINTVTASAGGTFTGNDSTDSKVSVTATDTGTVSTEGWGASGGAAVAGAVISNAYREDGVTASVSASSVFQKYQQLDIEAKSAPLSDKDKLVSAAATGTAGGLLAAGYGAQSVAHNTTKVLAQTGTDVTLPAGNVSILATNNSAQQADATGAAGIGLFAASGAVADAFTDGMSTMALLGDRAVMLTDTGLLTIAADATDDNEAKAVAGAYGVAAGNAAVTDINGDSVTFTGIGKNARITAGAIVIDAEHSHKYFGRADSTNASVVGGSGAAVTNDLASRVNTEIGSGTTLTSRGTITQTAVNSFGTAQSGKSVSAGGGGVLNAAAAVSKTTISGTAVSALDDDVALTSGTDPFLVPGRITIVADSILNVTDEVVLKTGGLLAAGAGTNSKIKATLKNDVKTGKNDQLTSLGNIDIGSYTSALAAAASEVSTWGTAAVGVAKASTDLTTDQEVTIADNSSILAFGNVNITAGSAPDGSDSTFVQGTANAEGYVSGVIAIPAVDADAKVASNASLAIGKGAAIKSGENTVIGAYYGDAEAAADGTGHGYQLGFIAVTQSNSDKSTSKSAKVTQKGDISAGIYHNLQITIDKDGKLSKNSDSADVSWDYEPQYDLKSYITTHYDAATANVLLSGMKGNAPTYILGPMFAAGGTIKVNADTFDEDGTGSLTSYGAPKIEIENNSNDTLIMGAMEIPNQPGAEVIFTGAAGSSKYHGTVKTVGLDAAGKERSPQIIVENTSKDTTQAPGILLAGDVENLGGSISIINNSGCVGQAASVLGETVTIVAPQGSFVVSLPDGYYSSGGENPYSRWENSMIWPGGDPAVDGTPSADGAIVYVANYAFNRDGSCKTNTDLMEELLSQFGKSREVSYVFLGKGLAGVGKVDFTTKKEAKSISPVGDAYSIATGKKRNKYDNMWFPVIPVKDLTKTVQSYPDAGASSSSTPKGIEAQNVLINAKYIDINSTISAGNADPDWSLVLSSVVGGILKTWRKDGEHGTMDIYPGLGYTVNRGDSLISAKYDFDRNKIILQDNLSASGSNASIILNGAVISTNTMGKLQVNCGQGEVTVKNETGIPLEIQSVNTGNTTSATGSVVINDSLTNTQKLYYYVPGTGMSVYSGAYARDMNKLANINNLDGLTKISSGSSSSAAFNPYGGIAWQWQREAMLTRDVSYGSEFKIGNWTFSYPGGQPNDPWYYVVQPQKAIGALPGSYHGGGLSTNPQGHLIVRAKDAPAFQQEITADYDCYEGREIVTYHSSYGLKHTTDWSYYFPTAASITMTMTAKADNPIAIGFSGKTRGVVNVTSNAPVTLAGKITNPSGDTTVTVSSGGIRETAAAAVLTHNLTLNSPDRGIGSAAQPFAAALTNGGELLVNAGSDGVYLNLDFGAVIDQVSAVTSTSKNGTLVNDYGDVVINAAGSLTANQDYKTNIQAGNITLNTTAGSVGSGISPLAIGTHETKLANGGTADGIANISAPDDIGIRETNGDLLIGQIKSTSGGSVYIDVPDGTLYNADGQIAGQSLPADQAEQLWKNLGLRAEDGAETGQPTDTSVVNFQNVVNRYYHQYWKLRGYGSVSDGVLTLSDAGIAALKPAASQALNTAVPTNEQIQVYANGLFQTARTYLGIAEAGGLPDSSGEASVKPVNVENVLTAYDGNFAYTASAEQRAKLTANAVWTENALTGAISCEALQASSGTQVSRIVPNIVGRNVTITAGRNVGRDSSSMFITLTDLKNGLTQEQKAALVLAKSPGDILGVAANKDGRTVTFSFTMENGQLKVPDTIAAQGFSLTGFQLTHKSPVYVDADRNLSALSGGQSGSVYLQETDNSRKELLARISDLAEDELTYSAHSMTAGNKNNWFNFYQLKGSDLSHELTNNLTLISGIDGIVMRNVPQVYIADDLSLVSVGKDTDIEIVNNQ